jgi:hypothetical protein
MARGAQNLLQAHRDLGRVAAVVDGEVAAERRGPVLRREAVDLGHALPADKARSASARVEPGQPAASRMPSR